MVVFLNLFEIVKKKWIQCNLDIKPLRPDLWLNNTKTKVDLVRVAAIPAIVFTCSSQDLAFLLWFYICTRFLSLMEPMIRIIRNKICLSLSFFDQSLVSLAEMVRKKKKKKNLQRKRSWTSDKVHSICVDSVWKTRELLIIFLLLKLSGVFNIDL